MSNIQSSIHPYKINTIKLSLVFDKRRIYRPCAVRKFDITKRHNIENPLLLRYYKQPHTVSFFELKKTISLNIDYRSPPPPPVRMNVCAYRKRNGKQNKNRKNTIKNITHCIFFVFYYFIFLTYTRF